MHRLLFLQLLLQRWLKVWSKFFLSDDVDRKITFFPCPSMFPTCMALDHMKLKTACRSGQGCILMAAGRGRGGRIKSVGAPHRHVCERFHF